MGIENSGTDESSFCLREHSEMIHDLKGFAIRGLKRMYLPEHKMFVFRFNRVGNSVRPEGMSRRYTAISLIGLADCDEEAAREILVGHTRKQVCERLQSDIENVDNLGDVALSVLASIRNQYPHRDKMVKRLVSLEPHSKIYPTVELCWALDALCREPSMVAQSMAKKIAKRLIEGQYKKSGVFPHLIGTSSGFRGHVSCFADAVYPIHALSSFHKACVDNEALDAAVRCADVICRRQGADGQWWWHYDVRNGRVVEGYPVYSVHQDSMGPMALFALRASGGPDHRKSILKGLEWLYRTVEINQSLLDRKNDFIWRKVGRKEPKKLTRLLQAMASRVNESLRVPGVDLIFPAQAIDYENRPYHLGWILYAWNNEHTKIWME